MGGMPAKRAKTEKKATGTEIDIKSAGETPEDLKKTIVAQLIKRGRSEGPGHMTSVSKM